MSESAARRACRRFLRICRSRLNREARDELAWYQHDRPKRVSGRVLFEQYAWALLVSGISGRAATTWTDRTKFWRVFTPTRCCRYSAAQLIRKVGIARWNKFGKKLTAIHALGRSVAGSPPRRVADRYLGGETRTAKLGEQHARILMGELPLIRLTSARFIVRNLGGELIKDDRWLEAIRKYFVCSYADFEEAGRSMGWKLGKVDLVVWCYCQQEIKSTRRVPEHLRSLGL